MKEIYDKLREDEHYYGDFGKQFLSNSDISTLLKNPKDLHKPKPSSPALLVGGYFHTAILEPDKLNRFKIVEATTRNTKAYKEILKILEAAKKRNLLAGIHNGGFEYAQKMISKGFNLVTIGSDQRFLSSGPKTVIEKIKGTKKVIESKGY